MNEIIHTQIKKRKIYKNDITNKYLNNNTNLFVHKEKNNNILLFGNSLFIIHYSFIINLCVVQFLIILYYKL